MPKGLLPSAGALPPYHSYALMLSLCELIVHKPLVPLQLSLIGINLTVSFWGLFPLPVLDLPDFPWLLPAWKVILGLSFYFLLNLPSAPSICTAVGLLILQVEKFFLWISNGDICQCLTDYSKMDHTLLWLNRMRCWWGGARMQSKRMWDGRAYNKINKLTLINTSKRKIKLRRVRKGHKFSWGKNKAEFVIKVLHLSPKLLLNTNWTGRYLFCPKHG